MMIEKFSVLSDVASLWDMDGGAVTSGTSAESKFTFDRMDSISAFNSGSEANEMLRGLRYFERGVHPSSGQQSKVVTLKDKLPYSWGPVDMKTVATALIDLSNNVRAIFLQEPRLLKLKAPIYILGKKYSIK